MRLVAGGTGFPCGLLLLLTDLSPATPCHAPPRPTHHTSLSLIPLISLYPGFPKTPILPLQRLHSPAAALPPHILVSQLTIHTQPIASYLDWKPPVPGVLPVASSPCSSDDRRKESWPSAFLFHIGLKFPQLYKSFMIDDTFSTCPASCHILYYQHLGI